MLLLLLLLLFYSVISQELAMTLLDSKKYLSIDCKGNQVYAATVNFQELASFDLDSGLLLQNTSLGQSSFKSGYPAFTVGDQYFYLGFYAPSGYIMAIPLNTFTVPTYTPNALSTINCLVSYHSQLFIGTDLGLEIYDQATLNRLQTYSLGQIREMQIYNQSLFTIAVVVKQWPLSNLNLETTYYADSSIMQCFRVEGNYLYIGFISGLIKQYDLNSQQFIRKLTNHTDIVITLVTTQSFLFSGSYGYWIQWHIDSGQLIRKINYGGQIYDLMIYSAFLLVAGTAGLIKYHLPDLLLTADSTIDATTTAATSLDATTMLSVQTEMALTTQAEQLTELIFLSPTKTSTTTTSTVKKQLAAVISGSQEMPAYFIPTVIGLSIGIIFICIFCTYRVFYERKKQNIQTKSTTDEPTSTSTSSVTATHTQHTSHSTSSSFTETDHTLIGTHNIYSIPGHLLLTNEELRSIKRIAKGGQGTVSLAEFLNPNLIEKYKVKQVVLKSTGKPFEQLSERERNVFNQEMAIIYYFRDRPGFVRLFGYTEQPNAALILKYYHLGSMQMMIEKSRWFTKRFIILFLWELSKAIFLLHDAGFVHCDLKPQNILLEKDLQNRLHPVLTDFGITQIVSDKVLKVKAMTIENLKGFSLHYAAPEQILQMRQKVYRSALPEIVKRRDIYSIGSLLYTLLMKKEPWHE